MVSVRFSCHHSGKYRRDSVSSIFSPAILSISIEGEGPETSSYRTTTGDNQGDTRSICLIGLLSFFACFTEQRLFVMWNVLNHFWIFWIELQHELDEPNNKGISLLSACPLMKLVSNKDTVVRNASGFCETVSRGSLGQIWHFASRFHAQISELSFQWCKGDITSSWEKQVGQNIPLCRCYGYVYVVILLQVLPEG